MKKKVFRERQTELLQNELNKYEEVVKKSTEI